MTRLFGLLVLVAASLVVVFLVSDSSASAPPVTTFAPREVVAAEDTSGLIPVNPGDTLTLTMHDDPLWLKRCENLGGTPVVEDLLCRDVDY